VAEVQKNRKMKNIGSELRMYGIVPYNISEIQKGIQFGHGVVEYMLQYGTTPLCKDWATNHKTFIILNGGTTRNSPTISIEHAGTMQQLALELSTCVPMATFYEPDLNNALTSVNFIVEDRIFSDELSIKDNFLPEARTIEYFLNHYDQFIKAEEGDKEAEEALSIGTFLRDFLVEIGGVRNLKLRTIVENLKLA
jgi:hypothetical protein